MQAGDWGFVSKVMENYRHAGRFAGHLAPLDTDGVTLTTGLLNLGTSSAPWANAYIAAGGAVYIGGTQLTTEGGIINASPGFVPHTSTAEFGVIQRGSGAQIVEVQDISGTFWGGDGSLFNPSVASNTALTMPAAHSTLSRWDLITVDASGGIYAVTTGTAATNPAYPTTPTTGVDDLALVYRPANVNTVTTKYIFDARDSIKVKTVDGHFKTNFGIDQKEDTEDSEYNNQQTFQMIPFGTNFDQAVQPDKTFLHNVETVLVPAFSHEITESGAGWSNSDSASMKFGRSRTSSTSGDTIKVAFTGVSCGVAMYTSTDRGTIEVELSSDAGATWKDKKTFTTDAGGSVFNTTFDCYSGLEYGDYEIRVTIGDYAGSANVVSYFYYTTYMNQRPVSQQALASGGANDIDDLPPTTCLITGTWTQINHLDVSTTWNSIRSINVNTDADIQFKFYGSACWVNCTWGATADVTQTVLIDGSSAKVKSTTFNCDTPSNNIPQWIRLDDGTLDEGWHTIRIDTTTATSGFVYYNGFGYYSENAPTTIARSLICGKNSYSIGADNSGFTYNGTWTGLADVNTAFLRRENFTTTSTDNVTVTTPNDSTLKAIYLHCGIENATGAELAITIGGALTRYITLDTSNYDQDSMTFLLYDSFADGDLHNLSLVITNNDGGDFPFQGLTYEIGDAVESNSIWCMPKWTRYNTSTGIINAIASSHRLDVYGAKSDGKQGRAASVQSGFYNSGGSVGYYRHGLGVPASDFISKIYSGSLPSNSILIEDDAVVTVGTAGDPGIISNAIATTWTKIVMHLNRVI